MISHQIHTGLLFFLAAVLSSTCSGQQEQATRGKKSPRIAVIGGGIAGTFVSKYLVDYDTSCLVDSLTLFDPTFSPDGTNIYEESETTLQGGRVSSMILDDGAVVELGASIIFSGNKLVSEMVDADPTLVRAGPHANTPPKEQDEPQQEEEHGTEKKPSTKGFGIWDGEDYLLNSAKKTQRSLNIRMLYRYNFDLVRLTKTVDRLVVSFNQVYDLLDSTDPSTFFQYADEIWDALGLLAPSHMSFDAYLDTIGISRNLKGWKSYIRRFGFGELRKELITSVNLSNYNQNNSQMNGLSGLVSFVPTNGELFSIMGGNYQIPISAWKQAAKNRESRCTEGQVRHVPKQVTSVIAKGADELELWSGQENLGVFDIGKSFRSANWRP